MKRFKKVLAVILCAITVALCFAGCSKSTIAEEVTAETLLIAYTQDNKPFIYEEDGKLKGLDVEIFEKIFKGVKNDYKNYKFVKVDADYKIGEDVYCVDKDGKECIAYIMAGGVQKNVDDINETYTFTEDIINNKVITVTKDGNSVTNYTDINGKEIGVIKGTAAAALDKHSAVKAGCKSVTEYSADKITQAVSDLEAGKIKALVIDEFNYYTAKIDRESLIILDGELENISYVYAFKKHDWYVDSINEAIKELQDPSYNDADELTPIVEKYFGYDACNFNYVSEEK